jgi:hypothetical protein
LRTGRIGRPHVRRAWDAIALHCFGRAPSLPVEHSP